MIHRLDTQAKTTTYPEESQKILKDSDFFKFLIVYTCSLFSRLNQPESLIQIFNSIFNWLENNIYLSLWILDTFSCKQIIFEFLIECPLEVFLIRM